MIRWIVAERKEVWDGGARIDGLGMGRAPGYILQGVLIK